MKTFFLFVVITIGYLFASCEDNKANELKEHLQREYTLSSQSKKLSSGNKIQYIKMEESINLHYVKSLDSLVNTSFERQLKKFEDSELGVWSSYMNMFSWLFKSKQSWEDEMNLLSNKYFNTLDINQEQYALYMGYKKQIEELRNQFVASNDLPTYTQICLPSERISLEAFANHARNNIGIELIGELLGSKLFSWFLGFVITWIIVTLLGLPTGPPGWIGSVVTFIIILVVSTIMSVSNDSKLMSQIREQRQQEIEINSNNLYQILNENTIKFYEKRQH